MNAQVKQYAHGQKQEQSSTDEKQKTKQVQLKQSMRVFSNTSSSNDISVPHKMTSFLNLGQTDFCYRKVVLENENCSKIVLE